MTLLDQASLIITPNAIKVNKLYSIVPTNGNGDLDYTRNSVATIINSSDAIEIVPNDTPRLSYESTTCPHILVEGQKTNLLLNSDVLSTQTLTPIVAYHTLSFYSGGGSITLSGAATGTLNSSGSTRVFLGFTPTATPLTLTVSGTVLNAQLEITGSTTARTPTSYIPTTATTVTRLADILTKSNLYTNNIITSAGGTLYINLINGGASYPRGPNKILSLGDNTTESSSANAIVLGNTNSTAPRSVSIIKKVAGAYTVLSSIPAVPYYVIKWDGTKIDVFINGVKTVIASAFTSTILEHLFITGDNISEKYGSIILFPTPLTDTECILLSKRQI